MPERAAPISPPDHPSVVLPVPAGLSPDAWYLRAVADKRAAGFVALAAGTLAWLGSQLPQTDAPWPATDGLARPDLQLLAALGLDSLLSAGPAMLVAVAITGLLLATVVRLRPTTAAAVVAWLAALTAIFAVVATATAPRPVWLEVPVGAPMAPASALVADAGRLVAAGGRWSGRCERKTDTLTCSLQTPGAVHQVVLQPGVPAQSATHLWTWTGRAATPLTAEVGLYWRDPAGGPGWRLALRDRQTVDVAALHARLTPLTTRTAGPLILAARPADPAQWSLLVSPTLAPDAPQRATITTGELVLLQMSAAGSPIWLWWLSAALVAGAAGLQWIRRRQSPLPAALAAGPREPA
jgi:hypothetical protein